MFLLQLFIPTLEHSLILTIYNNNHQIEQKGKQNYWLYIISIISNYIFL